MKAPGPAKGSLVRPFCKSAYKLYAKRMFQAESNLNSCIFSIGFILTSRPKWDFCVKSKSWSYEDWGYFFFRFFVDVCRAVTIRRQRNRHDYFKWIQSSLERKKKIDLSSLVYGLKRTFHQEILCLSRAATARKSDQKACAIMHVQSFRVIFCLLKTIALIFWLCKTP